MVEIVQKFFPVSQMILCWLGAIVYVYHNKWWDAGYWFFAGALTFTVIFRR